MDLIVQEFTIQGFDIPLMQHLNLSFCFGLTLNHCDNPPSVDYYLQLASPRNAETYERIFHLVQLSYIYDHTSFLYTLKSQISKRIPYTPCSGTESVPVLQKPPKCIPYKPSSITTSKPHTGKSYSTKYPPHVKPTKSPVAPTKSTQGPPVTIVTTAKHMPKTSETITMYTTTVPSTAKPHTVKPHPTKYQPHTTTTQHSVAPGASKTLGKPCTPGAMQGVACEKNETCVAQGPIFPTWNPHVKKTTQSAATVQPNVQVSTSRIASHQASGTKINMTALIVGSILGGLIVIVLIATVVIFVIRKRRMYYRGHQLLLSEEDTDVVI
ncbi:hypothetical protein KUTeg_010959 [Tegillarca granosa]|uniref:Uncharacterized protein n=1 Tax=Tegillarca granosa TaxID=220873 RepID=A0ABQ9F2H4_TEGGR|nr:hypothetical protein KUTeg_010959 [Tegillarca granosa]